MISIFEKYIRSFGDHNTDDIAFNLNIPFSVYKEVIDAITDWYYDEYHLTFLGAGVYGSAFCIDNQDNLVLKVTQDLTEAANVSFLVKKNNVKGIVEYYDIHEVEVYFAGEWKFTLFSIIMEKLNPTSTMEKEIFMLVYKDFLKTKNGGSLSNIVCISEEDLGSLKEFKENNPKHGLVDFFEAIKNDYIMRKYDSTEVINLANVYYDDIMDIISSSYKYNLLLSDIHQGNICRTDDEHMKLIDVGGEITDKKFRTKSAKIYINIE